MTEFTLYRGESEENYEKLMEIFDELDIGRDDYDEEEGVPENPPLTGEGPYFVFETDITGERIVHPFNNLDGVLKVLDQDNKYESDPEELIEGEESSHDSPTTI